MAEDRFANVFSAAVTMSAANTLTFVELNFGIQLRDKLAIVIDQVFIMPTTAAMAEMTTNTDTIITAITNSDSVTDISDFGDRRNIIVHRLHRQDYGTAASAEMIEAPHKVEFAPPMIALPTRMFLGVTTAGLASAAVVQMRMHFRTIPITSDQMLTEVLESFQLST